MDAQALARLLAPLLYLKVGTILRDISRRSESLPSPLPMDGRKIWAVEDVVDFYPPAIGAAIRRAIAREFQDEILVRQIDLPARRSLAEDLAACTVRG